MHQEVEVQVGIYISIAEGFRPLGRGADWIRTQDGVRPALPLPPIPRIRINDARWHGKRVIVYPMKPRTPGFWLIVATVGLLALLPMQAFAGMTPEEVELYKNAKSTAEKGDAESQGFVGGCYYYGEGVTKDYAEAAKWFRKAAEQGNALSQNFLGACYESGKGVPKNLTESQKWHRKAADQGFSSSQLHLGICYLQGLGVTKDPAEAVKWFRRAAERGEWFAYYFLGDCYGNGKGVPKNLIESYAYYKLAETGRRLDPDSKNDPDSNLLILTAEKNLEKKMTKKDIESAKDRSSIISLEIDAKNKKSEGAKKAGK